MTLISITGSVEAIRDGLNRAYGCKEDRHLIRRYFSSVFFVFVSTAFLLVVAGLGIAVPIVLGILERYMPGAIQTSWIEPARQALLALVTLAMLLALHLFLPAKRRHIKNVVGGVFFTLFGWWLAGKIFGLYITEIANYTATYAGLAGIVILMFFLYIQALIFLLGAEMNRSIADLRGNTIARPEREKRRRPISNWRGLRPNARQGFGVSVIRSFSFALFASRPITRSVSFSSRTLKPWSSPGLCSTSAATSSAGARLRRQDRKPCRPPTSREKP